MSQAVQTPSTSSVLPTIAQQLRQDLAAPRFLIDQVLNEISARHEYAANQIGLFFTEKYGQLEDYEIDLVFSPLFTPNWDDQLRYAKLVGSQNLAQSDIQSLINTLENETIETTFQTQTGESWRAPLHPVNLDRFVNRLILEKPLSDTLRQAIEQNVPQEDHHAIFLLARNPVWDGPQREQILSDYLSIFNKRGNYSLDKVRFLTDFVRTYRPATPEDLPRQLESLVKSCEADLNNVADQSFYDEQFKELYSDSERAHYKNINVQNHYNYMMEMAAKLLEDYKS